MHTVFHKKNKHLIPSLVSLAFVKTTEKNNLGLRRLQLKRRELTSHCSEQIRPEIDCIILICHLCTRAHSLQVSLCNT
jgi:hypothetical protein